MSDAGVRGELELDISAALAEVSRLQRALEQAVQGITVEVRADASAVPGEVTSAVEAADTDVLVTGNASDVTGEVTGAVDAADTDVLVTGDASEITGDVTSAVAAADTDVLVTGEASGITGEITSAVNAADTDVLVTGDASPVTGSVSAAVDAADTTVQVNADGSPAAAAVQDAVRGESPYGPVEVGGSVSPQLITDVGNLSANLAEAADEGAAFRSAIGALATAGAVVAINRMITAASDLEQAVGGTQAVFGQASAVIDEFAANSVEAAGLTETAARTLTSQLGGLLQGFGFLQEDAAAMSVQLTQLGADLAATFGGEPQQAVEALGAALRGEFDPLEQFGISLNVTQANLRAVEMGLASSTSEVGLNERAQASLAIIMERSANAQGQFAREATTTAGQLVRTQAEAAGAATAIGQNLQPAMNDLLQVTRAEIIPALRDLGVEVGPDLVGAFTSLLPLVGSTVDLMVALSPVVSAVASTLDAIPEPVLQMIAAFATLRGLGIVGQVNALRTAIANVVVPTVAVEGAFNRSAAATATWGTRLRSVAQSAVSPATLGLAALTVGVTLFTQRQQENAEAAREQQQRVESLAEAMREADTAVEGLEAGLTALVEQSDEMATLVANAGLSAADFTSIIQAAEGPLDALTDSLQAVGLTAEEVQAALVAQSSPVVTQNEVLADSLESLIEAAEDAARSEIALAIASGELTEAQAESILGAENVVDAYSEWRSEADQAAEAAEEAARQQLLAGEAAGEFTRSEVQAALASEDVTEALQDLQDEAENTATAMDLASDVLERHEGASGRSADANRAFADELQELGRRIRVFDQAADASVGELARLIAANEDLAFRYSLTQHGTSAVRERLSEFALAAGDAAVSSDDLEAAAAALGVNMDDLQFFIDGVNSSVEEFANAVADTVPTTTELLGEMDDGFDPEQLRRDLEDGIQAITSFQGNLEILSAFPNLASQAAQQGPEYVQEVVDWIANGNREAAHELDDLIAFHGLTYDELERRLNTEFGPNFQEATGETGRLATEAFGDSFDIETETRDETQAAEAAARDETAAFPELYGDAGNRSTFSFDEQLKALARIAARETGAALDAVRAEADPAAEAAGEVGERSTSAYRQEMQELRTEADRATGAALDIVRGRRGRAREDGQIFGAANARGYEIGVSQMEIDAARETGNALDAVRSRQGGASSAGRGLGNAASGGFSGGVSDMPARARSASASAASAVRSAAGTARSSGFGVGQAAGEGLESGIAATAARVAAAARAVAAEAAAALRSALQISSPSRVFEELGEETGAGFALGMANSTEAVVAAADRMASASTFDVGVPSVPGGSVDPQFAGLAGAGGGAGAGDTVTVQVQPGAVVINVPRGTGPREAQELGRRAGAGFRQGVVDRRVLVDGRTA